MEKKNIHFRQGSNKVLVSEPRKSTETYLSRTKNARRRENANLSNSKPDVQRSSKPTKIRSNVDKSPRPRSNGSFSSTLNIPSPTGSGLEQYTEATVAVAADEQDDLESELNSVYSFGSKKQNLNHLLNFHYSPRESENSNNFGANLFGRYGNRNYANKHKYNKEQFLQANFQFVINSGAEAAINSSSPDTLVDWGIIEQINIQTTEEPQCPICLYPPIAAKLTRCGHLFCWPCILHYLALTDKSWRKCPICYEAVHINDLKSTAIVQNVNFKVGDFITLQLMKRKKSSMFIKKVNEENDNNFGKSDENNIPHLMTDEEKEKFSKFILANSREILSILKREETELKTNEELDCPEYIFYQQALNSLNDRKLTIEKDLNEIKEAGENSKNLTMELNNMNLGHHGDDGKMKGKVHPLQKDVSTGALPKESGNGGKQYYFYQSVDGQNIFLHPLNVKMLQAMYGTLDKGPTVIEATIVQKEIQSMNEEERRKFTCLGHLPLKCEFEIVELQLEPPIVSEEVFQMFKDDILMRQKTRIRRAREEKKREKEIDRINDRQMGKLISRSANINIQSALEFPVCGLEEFGNSYGSYDENSFHFELTDSSTPPSIPAVSGKNVNKVFTLSFANILSAPKRDELWPSLDEQISSENAPVSEIVWVKHKPSVANQPQTFRGGSLSESENSHDGFGDAAHYTRQNISDILVEALIKEEHKMRDSNTSKDKNKKNNVTSTGNGSKKNNKGKGRKTVLFSTGMTFNGT